MMNKTFKIVLLGDGGVGKSTWVKKCMGQDFDPKYIATLGVDVQPIRVDETHCFNIWDCAGQEKFGGLRDGYYVESHGVIIMFDLTSVMSFKNVTKWLVDYLKINTRQNQPKNIILCGAKCDLQSKVSDAMIANFVNETKIRYVPISSKSDVNIFKPLQELAQTL